VAALVRDARDGDPQAFRRLVDAHYARALRFARNMGLAAEDAEEAVQDTFVRVWNALPRFRDGAPVRAVALPHPRRTAAAARWCARKWCGGPRSTTPTTCWRSCRRAGAPRGTTRCTTRCAARSTGCPRSSARRSCCATSRGMEYADMMGVTGAGLSALKMRVKRASDALRARLTEARG
jgi:RNA polymerase sigma-70 factor (ECF subfamily)